MTTDGACCAAAGAENGAIEPARAGAARRGPAAYRPLAIILAYVALGATLPVVAVGDWSIPGVIFALMMNFMGAFMIVFSLFKMLDVRGFAASFKLYDPLAKVLPGYAAAYPFIELGLGAAFAARVQVGLAAVLTLIVMSVGAVGVAMQLRRGRRLRCACLGGVIDLPLGTVSLLEDAGMAGMAALMLLLWA